MYYICHGYYLPPDNLKLIIIAVLLIMSYYVNAYYYNRYFKRNNKHTKNTYYQPKFGYIQSYILRH